MYPNGTYPYEDELLGKFPVWHDHIKSEVPKWYFPYENQLLDNLAKWTYRMYADMGKMLPFRVHFVQSDAKLFSTWLTVDGSQKWATSGLNVINEFSWANV